MTEGQLERGAPRQAQNTANAGLKVKDNGQRDRWRASSAAAKTVPVRINPAKPVGIWAKAAEAARRAQATVMMAKMALARRK